ncbi:hypothetical protein [Helicobacter sp. MIT 05-5294]|uniref:hypothetical protein n=1 Tax=Helicobacter sp. MIT 05-5294 TaxID=1548150 RepID=UPI00051FA852|nr:hypothetical protein LS69_003140 [Helicobacter sp. MIT 05-5294]
MKIFRISLLLFCLGGLVFAKGLKLEGIIASVDNANKTITIDSFYGDSVVVKVLPNTEIELEKCGVFGMDKYGTFKDLLPGSFVEVKLYFQNFGDEGKTNPIAYEIEIECHKKKAY